jgi:anti-sigma B factor antagonist
MNFVRTDTGTATTLRIEGSLDAISTPELRSLIDALYKRMRAIGGKVNVAGLRDQPLAIFKLLRLDKVLVG